MVENLLQSNLEALKAQSTQLRADATSIGAEQAASQQNIQSIQTANTAGGIAKGAIAFADAYTKSKSRAERLEQAKRIEAKMTETANEAAKTEKLNQAVIASVPTGVGIIQGYLENPDPVKLEQGLANVAKNIVEKGGGGTVESIKIDPDNPTDFSFTYKNDKGNLGKKDVTSAMWGEALTELYGAEAAQQFNQEVGGFNKLISQGRMGREAAKAVGFDGDRGAQQAAGFVSKREEQVTGAPEDFATTDRLVTDTQQDNLAKEVGKDDAEALNLIRQEALTLTEDWESNLDDAVSGLLRSGSGITAPVESVIGGLTSALFGSEEGAARREDYNAMFRVAAEQAARFVKKLGGSDTEKELAIGFQTAVNPNGEFAENYRILSRQRKYLDLASTKSEFAQEWVNNFGSMTATDASGRDFVTARRDFVSQQRQKIDEVVDNIDETFLRDAYKKGRSKGLSKQQIFDTLESKGLL